MKGKYLIGEVSKYLDISKDTLRFYDKKGIISPVKDSSNGYRYYTNDEVIKLIYLIILKNLDVNLNEIKLLLNNCTLEELKKIIQEKQLIIEQRLKELNKVKKTLVTLSNDIDLTLRLTNKIEVINCPKLIFKTVEDEFDNILVKEIKKLHSMEWLDSVYYTSIISNRYFADNDLEKNIFDGVSGIIKVDLEQNRSDLIGYENYKIYNSKKCIHTVVSVTYEIYEDKLKDIKKFITDNNLTVTDETLCRFITFENKEYKSIDYVELWIPIE